MSLITNEDKKRLFKVANAGRHALLDGGIPQWVDNAPDFDKHFAGTSCLCVTPLGFDNTCFFGALDLDAKGDAPPYPPPCCSRIY